MHSHFPADGSLNATLRAASLDDLQEAIDCAERAWREPTWRNMLPHQRAKILHKVADLIESLDELAQMQSRDNGKPLAEARGLVMSAAGSARYFAAACELLEGELPTPRQADLLTLSRYEPLGVVAAITRGTRRSPAKCKSGAGDRRRKCGDPQTGGSDAADGAGAGADL
jgi:betaine-aldehyde dehydrogenase